VHEIQDMTEQAAEGGAENVKDIEGGHDGGLTARQASPPHLQGIVAGLNMQNPECVKRTRVKN
jgi:hypothetical protein